MSQSSIIAALLHELVSGGGNGNPLQYSCLENSIGRLAWWATDRVNISHSVMSIQLFTSPRTIVRWAPLSMGFSKQENWSGLLFPCPGDLLDSGIAGGLFTIRTTSEATRGLWARKIQRLLSTLSAGESAGTQGWKEDKQPSDCSHSLRWVLRKLRVWKHRIEPSESWGAYQRNASKSLDLASSQA